MATVEKSYGPGFRSTIWSEVQRAGRVDSPEAMGALESVIRKYYQPLRAHLQVKFRVDEEQAADWLHGFIERKVLLKHLLVKASPERGKFRTFLLNALDNFVKNELAHDSAKKRQPEGGFVSADDLGAAGEALPSEQRADPFALEWARSVVNDTLSRMEKECDAKGCPERWRVFRARVIEPILDGAAAPEYKDLINRFRFSSPAEAMNALVTAKKQFHRLLRQVVEEYAGESEDVEEEIRELKRTLSG